MGKDQLGQPKGVAVAVSARFVIAADLLLPEVVEAVMQFAGVLPHRVLDLRCVVVGDAAVDIDDVRTAAVVVIDAIAQADGRAVVETVLESELGKGVALHQPHIEVVADCRRAVFGGDEKRTTRSACARCGSICASASRTGASISARTSDSL